MSGSRLARVRNSSCSEASPVRGARAMRWACGAWWGARRPVAGDGAVQSQSGVQAWHRGGGGRQPGGRLCVAGGGSGVSPGAAGGSWVAPDRSIPLVPLPAVAASGQRVMNRVRPGTGRCPEGACHGRKGRRCKGARQPRGRRSGSNTRLTGPLASTSFATVTPQVICPWQCLYFLPLPQGHGSLRPTLGSSRTTVPAWAVPMTWAMRSRSIAATSSSVS